MKEKKYGIGRLEAKITLKCATHINETRQNVTMNNQEKITEEKFAQVRICYLAIKTYEMNNTESLRNISYNFITHIVSNEIQNNNNVLLMYSFFLHKTIIKFSH